MTGLINPISFQLDEECLKLVYKQPFSDLYSLPTEKLEELKNDFDTWASVTEGADFPKS